MPPVISARAIHARTSARSVRARPLPSCPCSSATSADGQEIDARAARARALELRARATAASTCARARRPHRHASPAIVWEGVARAAAPRAPAVRVTGRFERDARYGPQIDRRRGRRGPSRSTTTRCSTARRSRQRRWRPTCASWSPRPGPHLRALLDAVLGPAAATWPRFRDAPAAKRYHQAYRHGLLEHSLTVAQAVVARSRRRSPASTATSPSPARCCTTSASSTPTPPTRWRST